MIVVRSYANSHVALSCDPEQISEHLEDQGQFVWVHATSPSDDEIELLAKEFAVHHLAAEDLMQGSQRTKFEPYGTHALLVVRDCVLDYDRLLDDEIDVVFGERWAITIAQARKRGHEGAAELFDEAARRFEQILRDPDHHSADPSTLVYVIVDVVADRYFTVCEQIDDRLLVIENSLFDEQTSVPIQREMHELHRSLVYFRRIAAGMREVTIELAHGDIIRATDSTRLHLRDVADHMQRVVELIESQRELLTSAFEGHLALLSNQMNAVMKKMTSWGAILVSLSIIAGIYGMNFEHMPELQWRYGYLGALATMVAVASGLYLYFRRKGWL
jgi:magnesium transporter